jgi:neutral ceramidase
MNRGTLRPSAELLRCCGGALLALLAACQRSDGLPQQSGLPPVAAPETPVLPSAAQCVLQSPMLAVGAGIDAPGLRLEVDAPASAAATGACAQNRDFRFGAGLYDITGPVANTGGMGWENPQQVFSGLHTRQYARAFAIESPCNGQRVLFLSADIGLIWGSLRVGVLEALAADPALAAHYRPDNVMISATHTHAGPAGYSHDDGGNLFHYGYDPLVYDVIVNGMVESIRRAHAALEAHPETAQIRLAVGELLDTSINRSLPAFVLNNAAERAEFMNVRGEEVTTDKRFVQLNLVRADGSAVGVINWFGVHPTVIGPTEPLVSGDHKGYASLGFEKLMGTRYDATPGEDDFVAAFAQTDEGDASPNLFILERPWPDPTRGGGRDDYESNAIAGTKQLARALDLFTGGTPLTGPVDARFMHVQFNEVTVNDPEVLARLNLPPELDAAEKRTCDGALGPSFGAGAEDGPGPSSEGVSCSSDPDVLAAAQADAQVLINASIDGFPGSWPPHVIPPYVVSTLALCNVSALPPILGDFSCQAEKPIFLPSGAPVLPFQLFRIGNLALIGLPWEVTTMSARRIRRHLLETLAPAGVDTVVIAGLANEFVNYLTTREEFSSQQYEGASTLFGPWSQAAAAQESLKLARAMRDGVPIDPGPARPAQTPGLMRPPYNASDLPGIEGTFGALVADVPPTAAPGDTVRAEWHAGHPRNDLRLQQSYIYAERQRIDGSWEVVAQDRDPELVFVWKPLLPSPLPVDPPVIGPSTAEAVWTIPRNTPPGLYRLRHVGGARTLVAPLTAYEGVSSPFAVAGAVEACP